MRNRKTKKMIFCVAAACTAIVLAAVVLVAVFPRGTSSRYVDSETYGGTVYDATSGEHDHTDEKWVDLNEFTKDNTYIGSSSYGWYYLSDDLTVSSQIRIDGDGTEVNLCLNGHVLSVVSTGHTCILISADEDFIEWWESPTLNLYDCGGDMEKHYYKLRDDGVSYDFFDDAIDPGDSNTYDGYVRGGLIAGGGKTTDRSDSWGGGISVMNGGTLNMYGGTIAGNTINASGGGVCVDGGTFNMYGGSISGNCNDQTGGTYDNGGGGVCIHPYGNNQDSCCFRMYGGEIRNNYCAGHGGGVEVSCLAKGIERSGSGVVFEMYGGTIAGNVAEYGGGVSVHGGSTSTSTFKMSGGTIRDNVAESGGGGVYMETDSVTFEMSGGCITGNVQTNASDGKGAGGVDYEYDDTVRLSGTAYVYGNFCAGGKSNIGVALLCYVALSGPLTEGAMIGLTLYGHTQVTKTTDYASESVGYFVSDDDNYGVRVNDTSGYLELYAKSS